MGLISQGVDLFSTIKEQVDGAKADLSESELTAIEAGLERLTAARHEAHEKLQALIALKRSQG